MTTTNAESDITFARSTDDRDAAVAAVIGHAIDLGTARATSNREPATLTRLTDVDEELLRSAKSKLIERLHQRSDDFGATYGLRVIEGVLRAAA